MTKFLVILNSNMTQSRDSSQTPTPEQLSSPDNPSRPESEMVDVDMKEDDDVNALLDASNAKSTRTGPRSSNSGRTPQIASEKWEAMKSRVKELYLDQSMTLKDMRQTMVQQHGFYATEKQYKSRLRTWAFEKNVNSTQMRFIVNKIKDRQEEGKSTVFRVGGQIIEEEKINRFIRRHGDSHIAREDTPENVEYDTPEELEEINPTNKRVQQLLEETNKRVHQLFEETNPLNKRLQPLSNPILLPDNSVSKQNINPSLHEVIGHTSQSCDSSHAIILCWDHDETASIPLGTVQSFFEYDLCFNTHIYHIPQANSLMEMYKTILSIASPLEHRNLLTVYYIGQSRLADDGQLILTSCDTSSQGTVRWNGIQNILEEAKCDVLLLFDCYFASTPLSSSPSIPLKKMECIAASAIEQDTIPGQFTAVLLKELHSHIGISEATPLAVAYLYHRLLSAFQRNWSESKLFGNIFGRTLSPITPVHLALLADGLNYTPLVINFQHMITSRLQIRHQQSNGPVSAIASNSAALPDSASNVDSRPDNQLQTESPAAHTSEELHDESRPAKRPCTKELAFGRQQSLPMQDKRDRAQNMSEQSDTETDFNTHDEVIGPGALVCDPSSSPWIPRHCHIQGCQTPTVFSLESHLSKHISHVHNKSYFCTEPGCAMSGRPFSYGSDLKRHMKARHQPPVTCDKPGCTRKGNLQRADKRREHDLKYHGHIPCMVPGCPRSKSEDGVHYGFSTTKDLKTHLEMKH